MRKEHNTIKNGNTWVEFMIGKSWYLYKFNSEEDDFNTINFNSTLQEINDHIINNYGLHTDEFINRIRICKNGKEIVYHIV